MVLWEITLVTAYWLGIRRTYRLALKLERRLIGPKHPRIREFTHRRLRNVFDVALAVHKRIQSRDLSAGKSASNFILRFLDRARPSAKIRGPTEAGQKKLAVGRCSGGKVTSPESKSKLESPNRVLFSQLVHRSPLNQTMNSRMSVGMGRMCPGIQEMKLHAGIRPYSTTGLSHETLVSAFSSPRLGLSFRRGVFRDDIAQWIRREPMRQGTRV